MCGTPAQPNDPASEFRAQRHDFILHYYEMAVKDLERHLQMGWQTIVTAAGAIATLSAGQQGYLPIPVAVSTAFIVCFWGINNVIDANYWALRAIAFLANVEAVYFYKDDDSVFNPYAGKHPAYKLMDSLKVQFYAVAFILLVTIIFFVFHVAQRTADFSTFDVTVANGSYVKVGIWLFPVLLLVGLLYYTLTQLKGRVSDYLWFVTNSPGPGMLTTRSDYRLLDPKATPATPPVVVSGDELQKGVRDKLTKSEKQWTRWLPWIRGASILIIVALIILWLAKHRVFA
jgi:hypothetical protein